MARKLKDKGPDTDKLKITVPPIAKTKGKSKDAVKWMIAAAVSKALDRQVETDVIQAPLEIHIFCNEVQKPKRPPKAKG